MEKKFTRAMLCEEFGSKCRECPLFCDNNFKSLPCWLLDESDVQDIMKDYPYVDVKVRMIFNDIETRLTAVEKKAEKKVENKDEPKFTMFDVVDKKLYDKIEAKHEADCRLVSEYDLEIKKLKKQNEEQNDDICTLYSKYVSEEKERIRCEAVIKDLKFDAEKAKSWEKRYNELEYMYEKKDAENNRRADEIDKYRRHIAELKSKLFDLKNVENERDHYKGLYSSKCDDYDNLLAKQIKTQKDFTFYRNAYYECCSKNDDHIEKERDLKEELIKLKEQKDNYKNLFHSLNHKHQNVVGEMKAWKERAIEAEKPDKLRPVLENEIKALEQKLKKVEEKYDDACKMNKLREDVFEANLNLKKTIEAKDREIDLLRAELDKYKTDDECDDRWID